MCEPTEEQLARLEIATNTFNTFAINLVRKRDLGVSITKAEYAQHLTNRLNLRAIHAELYPDSEAYL